MKIISDYMRDEEPRHMLNALTQKTFGFDFEGWVTKYDGEDDYRLFYRGDELEAIERDKLYFPELSHA